MKKQILLRSGDIFEIPLHKSEKGYFQYISDDPCELNSNVIRVFGKRYKADECPKLSDIVRDDVVAFYHVYIKAGVKSNVWHNAGNVPLEGNIELPWFRSSGDFGNPKIKVSKNWHVWRVNDASARHVGVLDKEQQSYNIGGVWPPEAIQEAVESGKLTWFYPGY